MLASLFMNDEMVDRSMIFSVSEGCRAEAARVESQSRAHEDSTDKSGNPSGSRSDGQGNSAVDPREPAGSTSAPGAASSRTPGQPSAPASSDGGTTSSHLDDLPKFKFDSIVLCARELQPYNRPEIFPNGLRTFPSGIDVYCASLDDHDGPTRDEAHRAVEAAKYVIDMLDEGQRVLVSCAAGRNRSGLVTALVLVGRYGISRRSGSEHRARETPPRAHQRQLRGLLESDSTRQRLRYLKRGGSP